MKYPKKLYETNTHGLNSSLLIRTNGVAEPIDPPIEPEPEITCHSTANSVWFDFEDTVEGGWTEDQRYAIKVGNDVFNSDHSMSILGQQFELGGRIFSIPYSSGSRAAIYLDDYPDDKPVRVRFIPGPDPQYNTIYSVNQDSEPNDVEVEYVDKDTEFTVCLKPELAERAFTCAGATEEMVISFTSDTALPTQLYVEINDKWSFVYYIDQEGDNSLQLGYRYDEVTGEDTSEWITATYVGRDLVFKIDSRGPVSKYRIKVFQLADGIIDGTVSVSEQRNPTAFYNSNDESVRACVLSYITPAIGTAYIGMSTHKDNTNYTSAVYNVYMDGVDYGSYELTQMYDTVINEITISSSADSSGNLYLYFSTNGFTTFNVELKPSDDVDNNIYGISLADNPTTTYDSVSRIVTATIVIAPFAD